jgi:PRC-barrel domain/Domain of unknown function (DUF2382)
MPEHDLDTILSWRGRTVFDRKDEKIGKVGDLYLDDETGRAAYAGVRTGLFGRHESILPLSDVTERNGDLVVPYDAELVRDAPAIDPDASLDEAEQERLARHYAAPGEPAAGRSTVPTDGDRDAAPGQGGPGMVRSEEEVVTGATDLRPAERVRLRKVLVTEDVRQTVPVRREEIRLATDPPPEGTIERVEDVDER